MTSLPGLETSEQYLAVARRWFTEGWPGNLAMAGEIFSEELRTNGVHVGVAGPVRRIRDRLAGRAWAEGDELVRHLAAAEADLLGEDSPLMALARAGGAGAGDRE